MTRKQENYFINILKFIASIAVILIHCSFPTTLGKITISIARFAVPFFYLVSGYYSFGKSNISLMKQLNKIIKITVITMLVYFFINICLSKNIQAIYDYLFKFIKLNTLIEFLCFNRAALVCPILWYLFALIYTYIIYMFINKLKISKNIIYVIAVMLLLISIIIEYKYSFPWYYTGNFLFVSFPFFTMGNFINKYKNKILHINNYKIVVWLFVGILSNIIETMIFKDTFCNVGSTITSIALLIICINNPKVGSNLKFSVLLKKISTFIFLSHYAVYIIIENILEILHITMSGYLLPILIIVTTIMLDIIIVLFKIKLYRVSQ